MSTARARTRRSIRAVVAGAAVGALMALGLAAPAQAAVEFVDAPTRLYMLPNADGPLPAPIPFPLVPDGVLLFDGSTDLISQDLRKIEVVSEEPDCDFGPTYELTGCTAVQLDVGHGTLDFTTAPSEITYDPTPDDGVDDTAVVYQLPGGALVRDMDSADDLPALATALIGTTQQLNDALALLRYTPDEDYYYNGANPETLSVDLVPGAGSGSVTHDIQLRVLDLNDFPSMTVPQTLYQVDPGAEVVLSPAAEWEVTDEDNDEKTDGEDPPGSGDDPIDGTGQEFILIAWSSCGVFHFQGASGFALRDDLQEVLDYALDLGSVDAAWRTTISDAFFAIIPDEIESLPFATGNPNDYASAFAGVVDEIEWLNYHLDEITFKAVSDPVADTPLGPGVCDLRFLVTDIGNNGLPLQYLGDPPEGIAVPFFGFDIDTNDVPGVELVQVQVGEDQEIEVSLGDTTVAEGGADEIPVTISGPAEHPAFDLTVSTADGTGAVADVDYTSKSGVTVSIPADATTAAIPVDALQDTDYDPGETYLVTATGPATDPPGYQVTLTDPSGLVTIQDDDPAPDEDAPTVTIEQGASQSDPTGTEPVVFDVEFSEPVTGFENVDIVLSGTANATTATVTGTGALYTVEITDVGNNGTIVAEIMAGAAEDAAGNLSEASTSTDNEVTYNGYDEPEANDPPVLTVPSGVTTAPNTAVAVASSVTDPDVGAGTMDMEIDVAAVNGTTVTASGTFTWPEGTDVTSDTFTGTLAQVNAALAGLVFTPAPGATGTARLVLEIDDNGNTGTGGELSHTVAIDIEIAAPGDDDPEVNDPPVLTVPSGVTTTVDTAVAVASSVADPDVGAGTMDMEIAVAAVNGTTVTASGTFTWPEGTGVTSDTFTGTLAQVNAALADLVFTPAPGATGTARLVLEIDDNGNSGTGGEKSHTVPIDIEITAEADETAPTVTIEQAATQVDPALTLDPIVFTVVFSEDVTGFGDAAADLALAFTGTGTPSATVTPVDATTYTVSVSGMTGEGVLTATVPAAAAEDLAGNANEASTSEDNEVTIEFEAEVDPLTIDVPDDIVVDAPPGEPGVAVTFPPATASGGVPPVTVECDHASGDVYPIGVTTVTCTATDSAPIQLFTVVSDSFTITVNATEAPGGGGSGGSGGNGGSGGLPATGADPLPSVLTGIVLLLAGALALALSRRRRQTR